MGKSSNTKRNKRSHSRKNSNAEGNISIFESGDTAYIAHQHSKSTTYDSTIHGRGLPQFMQNLGVDPPTFYKQLSKFIKILPSKSKSHIWKHSVTQKINDDVDDDDSNTKTQIILDETENVQQIKRILCDAIIVYCKYKDPDKPKENKKSVYPHIHDITTYIYNNFAPLKRDEFENTKKYFPAMIDHYAKCIKST